MNTEQLKMILEALAQMGAEGKDAFIWWLVLDKGLPVIGRLLTLVAIVLVARALIAWGKQNTSFDELRASIGHSCYTDRDFSKTTKVLAQLVRDRKA